MKKLPASLLALLAVAGTQANSENISVNKVESPKENFLETKSHEQRSEIVQRYLTDNLDGSDDDWEKSLWRRSF